MPFDGLRVLSLESRRSAEIATLIRNQGGEAVVAPSMREVPVSDQSEAYRFFERLRDGDFDMTILLTGVGARALARVLGPRYGETAFQEALQRVTVVARGPKPAAVLREWGVPISVLIPEPNTWREVLTATEHRTERRMALQEYGVTNERLIEGLRARGAEVTTVRVYEYELPEDLQPLRDAVQRVADGAIDVVLFTTSGQVDHFVRVAREMGLEDCAREGLQRSVIASIGPTTSETLEVFGFTADLMPSHPKMGFLVSETAAAARTILEDKRT